MVDCDHVGHDAALHRLKDEPARKARREEKAAKGHQPPVAGLDTSRTEPLVPDLSCALVRRLWFGSTSIALYRTSEFHLLLPFLDVWMGTSTAAVAGADRLQRDVSVVAQSLLGAP